MQFKIRKKNQQPKRKKDCLACLEVKSENRAEIKRAAMNIKTHLKT